ncbi:histamine N-methyltransferase-like [Glandiceps talaboti]
MQEVEKLMSNEDEYMDDFKVLLRNIRVPKHDTNNDEFSMAEVFSNISSGLENEIRVLAIGTGSGYNDELIINTLTTLHQKIIYTVVEPMKAAVANYKEMVASNKAEWSGVEFKYYIQTIEKYLDDNQDDHSRRCERYDVIHAVHSAYYFVKRDGTFRDLYNQLNENGVLLIRVAGDHMMKSKMYINRYIKAWEYTGPADIEETLLKEIPSDTMAMQIKITKAYIVVTECFNEYSDEGNKYLDFITQIPKFRKSMPREIVQSFMNYIKTECVAKEGEDFVMNNCQAVPISIPATAENLLD